MMPYVITGSSSIRDTNKMASKMAALVHCPIRNRNAPHDAIRHSGVVSNQSHRHNVPIALGPGRRLALHDALYVPVQYQLPHLHLVATTGITFSSKSGVTLPPSNDKTT